MPTITVKLLRNIKTTYRQFLALVAMVMAGAALFVAFNTSLSSLISSRDNYYQEYGFADYYFNVIKAPQGVLRQIQALPGVTGVNGRIQKDINIIKDERQRITGRLNSYSESTEKNLYIIKGATFSQNQSAVRNGILIDPEFASGNQFKIGDRIKVIASGQEYVLPVIGIATSPELMVPNKSVFDMFLRGESFGIIMISQEQAEQILNMPGEINQVLVDFTPGTDAEALKKDIESILKPYGLLTSFPQHEQYSEKNMQFQVDALESASAFLPMLFFIMVVCFLFILLRQLIKSQRLHIGVLKA
ncbi:MAG: ABC transporter permease, partial [Syntrophomonadaceae bacterium]|nr:ABC transporter permease [Syntrophomonadaceae bacterium]